MNLNLYNCSLTCSLTNHTAELPHAPIERQICSLLPDINCKPNPVVGSVEILDILPLNLAKDTSDLDPGTGNCGRVEGRLGIKPNPCHMANIGPEHIQVALPADCSLECGAATNIVE